MFRFAVIFVHAFLFIGAIFIGLVGKYNPSSPEPDKTYIVWFLAIAIFAILVIGSAFVQLKLRKIWVFVLSTIGLLVLFYVLPHIVLYIEDFLS